VLSALATAIPFDGLVNMVTALFSLSGSTSLASTVIFTEPESSSNDATSSTAKTGLFTDLTWTVTVAVLDPCASVTS